MYRRAGKEPSRYLGSVRRRVSESQSLAAQTRGPLPGSFGGRAVSASTCPEYVGFGGLSLGRAGLRFGLRAQRAGAKAG